MALPAARRLATGSIQEAIDDCAAAGGGTVLIPPGEYTAGSIRLKDNIELRVEAGCDRLTPAAMTRISPATRGL